MRPKEQKVESGKLKVEDAKNQNAGDFDLGIDAKQAEVILNKYIKDPITKLHSVESKAIMEGLAKHFNEDPVKWGIVGLLHDIDWDLTKQNTKEHCVKAKEILKNEGASDFLVETIVSHGYGAVDNEEFRGKERSTKLQHALAASETLTGLIVASTLVQPDKKLKSLTIESLKKKFKSKNFAANCNREIIKESERDCGRSETLIFFGFFTLVQLRQIKEL
jgi:predicted hydrolase (HD superfamily)